MKKTPANLGEVMNKDLAGFQQVEAYFLKLSHGLVGFFPALISETEEMVVCLDHALAAKVMEKLPPRESQIVKMQILANIEGNFGFEMGNEISQNALPLHILTAEEFNQRVEQEKQPFKWTSGIIS